MIRLHCNNLIKNILILSSFVIFCYFVVLLFVFYLPPRNNDLNTESVTIIDKDVPEKEEFTAKLPPVPEPALCLNIDDVERFDCLPRGIENKILCENKGCCWSVAMKDGLAPSCFYPRGYSLYKYESIMPTNAGVTGFMNAVYSSPYPENIQLLRIDVKYETKSRVHVKIYDSTHDRYEPPVPIIPEQKEFTSAKDTIYEVKVDENKTGFTIIRKSTKKAIFDSLGVGGFTFANQFLQLSAKLSTNYLYGLGQHHNDDFLLSTNWYTRTLFNRDQTPVSNVNLYGSHPFMLGVEKGGDSFGVLFLNSNAMDIILQPLPAVTFRSIGGIFDFYFFLGPTPAEVIQQYTNLIGTPMLPPYWSLGFHLCRWGYGSLENTRTILENNLAQDIPVDVQWNDIDFMENFKIFTLNRTSYAGLKEFVEDLHKRGMHYIVIVDPGMSNVEAVGSYSPYEIAKKMDILVKNKDGEIHVGKVWNKVTTVFLDFTNPKTKDFWKLEMEKQENELFHYDGIWIDMNEPSNFINLYGCPDEPLENPPYTPAVSDGRLYKSTLCMTSKHFMGVHYNLHSTYVLFEAMLTYSVMSEATGKRPFSLSRSSFVGQGKYSFTWGGDNISTWNQMAKSIPYILNTNLFGMPFSGEDICGFQKTTTVPLCQRWMQLGAFYPFSRNHNSIDEQPQDPASLGPDVVNSSRKALNIRYTLLPYLYSLLWLSHINGDTVARPLFFEFPSDVNTYNISTHFLWGPAFLIIPVLSEGATTVEAYVPNARWFDYYSGHEIFSRGEKIKFSAPLDTIPLLLRGGHILPTQEPAPNTSISRKKKMGLFVVLNAKNEAKGVLYWDDGDSLEPYQKDLYDLLEFNLINNTLTSKVIKWNYDEKIKLGKVHVFGVNSAIRNLTVNNQNWGSFTYSSDSKKLVIDGLSIDMSESFIIKWNFL